MRSLICVEVFLCLKHLLHHKDLSPCEGSPHLLAPVRLVSGLCLWARRQRSGGQRLQPQVSSLQPVLACHRGCLSASVRSEDIHNEVWSKLVISVTLPELCQRLCPHSVDIPIIYQEICNNSNRMFTCAMFYLNWSALVRTPEKRAAMAREGPGRERRDTGPA